LRATLADKYNGKDRWYLEALGIGADQQWDRFFLAFARKTKNVFQTPAQRDIVWRARTELAVPYLAKFAEDSSSDLQSRLRYFRAFDFISAASKSGYLLGMIERNTSNDVAFNRVVLRHLDPKTVKKSLIAATAMRNTLKSIAGTAEYIELVARYTVKTEGPALLKLAINKHNEAIGRDAAGLLLSLGGSQMMKDILASKDSIQSHRLIRALSRVGSIESVGLLQLVALNPSYSNPTKVLAAEMIGKSWAGEEKVLELLKEKKVQGPLIMPLVAGVNQAWRKSVRDEASSYLPNRKPVTKKRTPTMEELVTLKANVSAGKVVYRTNCALCHQVDKDGFDFGPKLSEIGTKLPKEGLWEAIVHPSSGISFGYEGWRLDMKDGSMLTGIISSKTETAIDLKFPGGVKQTVKASDVISITELPDSMMPEDLIQSMNKQELADLMAYLSSLKKR
jgi:putative heme-binding domain-containing protein